MLRLSGGLRPAVCLSTRFAMPMKRLVRFFETLIDPFRDHDVVMPPPTLGGFYWHYTKQVWPALAALMPTLGDNDVVMLDLGANTDCDARNLVQFAIMGAAYSRIVTGKDAPRVRLLNIGTEENKGTEQLQEAAALLREATGLSLAFDGFVEANGLSRGDVDVVVTDGFSGNIALKAVEGTARLVADLLRRSFQSSLRSKFGFLVSRPATELLRGHLDPNNHNGAVFLGLNGVVVKSHGSATALGVANAVAVTARMLEAEITERITADLAELGEERLRDRGNGAASPSSAPSGKAA